MNTAKYGKFRRRSPLRQLDKVVRSKARTWAKTSANKEELKNPSSIKNGNGSELNGKGSELRGKGSELRGTFAIKIGKYEQFIEE